MGTLLDFLALLRSLPNLERLPYISAPAKGKQTHVKLRKASEESKRSCSQFRQDFCTIIFLCLEVFYNFSEAFYKPLKFDFEGLLKAV